MRESGQAAGIGRSAVRHPSPQYMPSLDGSVLVNTSEDTTCALNEAGEVRCWGLNTHGQIGLSPTDPSMSQCPANNGQCEGHIFHPLPHRIQGLEPVLDVVAGFQNTCAITRENELFCWGRSDMGILGVIEDDMPCGQDMNAGRCQPTPRGFRGSAVCTGSQSQRTMPAPPRMGACAVGGTISTAASVSVVNFAILKTFDALPNW